MATTVEPNRRTGSRSAPPRPPVDRDVHDGRWRPRPPIIQARSRTSDGSRALSAGSVVIVGIVVYLVTALLNSAALVKRSNGQGENAFQAPSQDVAEAIDRAAGWLFLDEPSEWAQEVRASDAGAAPEADADEAFGALAVGTATTVPGAVDPASATVPAVVDPTATTVPGAVAPTATTAPVTAAPPGTPVLRVPTAADPLTVYVAGDSLVGGWGQALVNEAGTGKGLDVELDYKVSTGLVRTDFYNWPGRLQSQIQSLDPDIVVLGFGGNDTQSMNGDDVQSPAYQAEYRKRVAAVMDYANQDGRKVIWVGTTNDPDPDRTTRLAVLNQIYAEEAAKRPHITYVNLWTRFASPEGGFAEMSPNADGEFIDVRAGDGFHLNMDGVEIVAGMLMSEIQNAVQTYGRPAG